FTAASNHDFEREDDDHLADGRVIIKSVLGVRGAPQGVHDATTFEQAPISRSLLLPNTLGKGFGGWDGLMSHLYRRRFRKLVALIGSGLLLATSLAVLPPPTSAIAASTKLVVIPLENE